MVALVANLQESISPDSAKVMSIQKKMGLNLVFKILVSKNYFGPAKGFHVHFSRTFWKCGAKVWRGAFSKYPIGGAKVKGLIYYGGAHLGKNPKMSNYKNV